jgi:hypothetical protein
MELQTPQVFTFDEVFREMITRFLADLKLKSMLQEQSVRLFGSKPRISS